MAYVIERCPVCDGGDLCRRAALVSPFLADYLFHGVNELCDIAQCQDCGLIYFARRLDEAETAQLYAGYRGETYFRRRHRREFWYTRQINDALGGEGDIAARRQLLTGALLRHCDPGSIDAVLDYGGGRGQILAAGPGQQRYVYDLSAAEPVAGVQRLARESDLESLEIDLLILCEVLEHASRPLQLLRQLTVRLKPGGLVFVTVPQEAFAILGIPTGGWYRRYLAGLSGSWALPLCDSYSTAVRVKLRRIPPLGFAKMHEHLNFFGIASLARLLERAGLDVLECTAVRGGPLTALGRLPRLSASENPARSAGLRKAPVYDSAE